MNIGRQWSDRLELWAKQFEKHVSRKVAVLETSFFTTMDHLPCGEAVKRDFAPAPEGTTWGKKWEYGWFRARFTVPAELAGERLELFLRTAEEMLVWVNGVETGSIDRHHSHLTLTRSAAAGTVYDIVAECYAGHGVRREEGGPVAFGEITVPEPPAAQVTVGESWIGVWNEPLFQAAIDYLTLYSLAKKLPEKSLRAMKVIEGLKKFTLIADFELPEPELTVSVVEADKVLRPLLACKNGSTAPEFSVFGQSHMDMAWLWPVEETMRKTARTYTNQLALMEEYPDYRFLLCEPPILEYLRELYPDVFRRVKEKAAEGRFYPDGAMWIESDTNIPSGESLIRQFAWGKRWFQRELGVDSQVAWMPDTFGFSGNLPQIMAKCGVPYFATQKLLRQDPEAEPFPYNLFWWEGIDGTRVLAHVYKKSNAVVLPGELITRWEEDRNQQEGLDGLMFPYGYGDGGGGPTREMVELAERCRDLEGAPRCRMESPAAFFRRAEQGGIAHAWQGELYLAWHRGTYTAQAETKRGIRKAEAALKTLEYHLARKLLAGTPVTAAQRETLERLWKTLLFNQFHDVAAGAGIARVHETAVRQLREVCGDAAALVRELAGAPGESVTVYNHLSWPRTFRGVEVPAQGRAEAPSSAAWRERAAVRALPDGRWELRNRFLTCTIDGAGELASLKISGESTEFLAGNGNKFCLYKDVNTCYDAWEIGSMYRELPVALDNRAEIAPGEDGDGVFLTVTKRLNDSVLTQRIFLGHEAKRLDFVTELDWKERHKLLKVAFPVNVHAAGAAHEIQFGYIRRPTHRSLRSDRDRYEVCAQRWSAVYDGGMGAAVLNDCKYGVSAAGSEISLTLMRAPLMPDMTADRGRHIFTYAIYPFTGPFTDSGVVREAAELNEPPVLGSGCHADAGPVFLPDAGNVIVDTVKPADTVENALLVRAYEAMGKGTRTVFTLSGAVRRVAETDMLEGSPRELPVEGGKVDVPFGAFEIKTFLLYL